jgi:hypothetical protein
MVKADATNVISLTLAWVCGNPVTGRGDCPNAGAVRLTFTDDNGLYRRLWLGDELPSIREKEE